jgi:glycosyltransferase involved in cell wall biosynthesis
MKLSIITINKDNASGLQKTIETVVSQSFTDFEYIVIDGNSTDGSVDIIKQYADKITYWVSEPDKGIYNAMNKGILKASGEYCQFLNSGDSLVDDDILKKVFDENLQEDIIYGDVFRLSKNGDRSLANIPEKWTLITFLNETISHSAAFIRRQLFSEISLYDEELNIVSDWVFFVIAIVINNKSYIHLPYCITIFESWGVSSDIDKCYLEKMLFFSKSPYTKLLFQKIWELQKGYEWKQKEYEECEWRLKVCEQKYEHKNIEFLGILHSKSFLVGRIILFPLRKIKDFFDYIKRAK